MRTIFMMVILLPIVFQASALRIPKSSLETVKQDLLTQLATAQSNKNPKEIARLQAQLDKVERKIKKFHHEWVDYRKRQLHVRSHDPKVAAEIRELDAYRVNNA